MIYNHFSFHNGELPFGGSPILGNIQPNDQKATIWRFRHIFRELPGSSIGGNDRVWCFLCWPFGPIDFGCFGHGQKLKTNREPRKSFRFQSPSLSLAFLMPNFHPRSWIIIHRVRTAEWKQKVKAMVRTIEAGVLDFPPLSGHWVEMSGENDDEAVDFGFSVGYPAWDEAKFAV